MTTSIEIFGELHDDGERLAIEKKIKELHAIKPFDFILSEETGDAVALTNADKQRLINNEYFSIGPRSYQLGMELNIPVIGIDKWGIPSHFSQEVIFGIREKQMLSVIEKYSKLGRVVVLVGDAHLREVDSEQLGKKSVLHTKLHLKPGVQIHRSPSRED